MTQTQLRLAAFDLDGSSKPLTSSDGMRVYVGKVLPRGLTAIHLPDGDIRDVARAVIRP